MHRVLSRRRACQVQPRQRSTYRREQRVAHAPREGLARDALFHRDGSMLRQHEHDRKLRGGVQLPVRCHCKLPLVVLAQAPVPALRPAGAAAVPPREEQSLHMWLQG